MAATNFTAIIQHLRAVSRALNQVEIKGRQNLEILLGSIQEIDQAAASLEISLKELDPPIKPEAAPNPPQKEPENQPE